MIRTRMIEVGSPGTTEPIQLAVHTCGQGPLAILMHGFPLDHRMWLPVMHGPLSAHRTLCAIDLRGHGASGSNGLEVHSMEQFADDVAAVIRSMSAQPVDACGLSMGGYVAFALHARHPELLRSLVLSNTRAAADTEIQRAGRDASIATVSANGATAIADAMLPNLLAASAPDSLRIQMREMIEQQSLATIVADLRGLQQRLDRRSELPHLQVPTLVLVGEHDAITPPSEAEQMAAAMPCARLQVIPHTGHMTPLEAPMEWSAAVASHWSC